MKGVCLACTQDSVTIRVSLFRYKLEKLLKLLYWKYTAFSSKEGLKSSFFFAFRQTQFEHKMKHHKRLSSVYRTELMVSFNPVSLTWSWLFFSLLEYQLAYTQKYKPRIHQQKSLIMYLNIVNFVLKVVNYS